MAEKKAPSREGQGRTGWKSRTGAWSLPTCFPSKQRCCTSILLETWSFTFALLQTPVAFISCDARSAFGCFGYCKCLLQTALLVTACCVIPTACFNCLRPAAYCVSLEWTAFFYGHYRNCSTELLYRYGQYNAGEDRVWAQ
jgi:hypothetical protein